MLEPPRVQVSGGCPSQQQKKKPSLAQQNTHASEEISITSRLRQERGAVSSLL